MSDDLAKFRDRAKVLESMNFSTRVENKPFRVIVTETGIEVWTGANKGSKSSYSYALEKVKRTCELVAEGKPKTTDMLNKNDIFKAKDKKFTYLWIIVDELLKLT